MQSPPIDPRDRAAFVARTSELARRYSGWQPPGPGRSDPGTALVGVFGRFAEIVAERLNRAPERGFLAFLDLIGTRPLPPRAARAPLTFTLAEGAATASVPAGTQVARAAGPDVVFETERPLALTAAQLTAVVTTDPSADRYRVLPGGVAAEPFAAFEGTDPVPHRIYVPIEPALTQGGGLRIRLRIDSTIPETWAPDRVRWACWDGEAWQPLATTTAAVPGAPAQVEVVMEDVPELPGHEIGGRTAGWLRGELAFPLAAAEPGLPEAVAVGRRPPAAFAPGLAPMGETASPRWFYLAADLPPGAQSAVTVALRRAGTAAATPPELVWSLKIGNEWREIGRSGPGGEGQGTFRDGTRGFTRNGVVSFRADLDWARSTFNGHRGRWLRAELVNGDYTVRPQLESLVTSYTWTLTRITAVMPILTPAASPGPPPAGFSNGSALDLGSDVYPFGTEPAFNATLHLQVPEPVARSGSFSLAVVLRNAAGKASAAATVTARPTLVWETFDGTVWRTADTGRTDTLTVDGEIVFRPAAPMAPVTVGGIEGYWVRARMLAGNYGEPAFLRFVPGTPGTPATATQPAVPGTPGSTQLVPATYAPPIVQAFSWRPGLTWPQVRPALENDFEVAAAPATGGFEPFVPRGEQDPALHVVLDRAPGPEEVSLFLAIEPPAPDEVSAGTLAERPPENSARVEWEYWGGDGGTGAPGWRRLAAVDETEGLTREGLVRFTGPAGAVEREAFGSNGFWIRARWRDGSFTVPPRLHAVRTNTTWAVQQTSVQDEILGSGSGAPGQLFRTAHAPVLGGERLVVREPVPGDPGAIAPDEPDDVWVEWRRVPDLRGSGPLERHYQLDPMTGEIAFGDGRSGRIPPVDANNVRISYRSGGGAAGNAGPGELTELLSTSPSVEEVTNHEPAGGGTPAEPLSRFGVRGPKALRHRDRAVTAEDFVDLALEASPEVVRARTLPATRFDPIALWIDPARRSVGGDHAAVIAGRVGVIVVPDSEDARPTPSLTLLRTVRDHLVARAPATADVWVGGPEWIRVTVTAELVPLPGELADDVRARATAATERYLHPLTGGPAGTGWAFGRKPHGSDLYALLEGVPGVDFVRSLSIAHRPESQEYGERLTAYLERPLAGAVRDPGVSDLLLWLDRALVYSGPHALTTTLRAEDR